MRMADHLAGGTAAVLVLSAGGVASAVAAVGSHPAAGSAAALHIGCVGVGTINSAVVRGLCTAPGAASLRFVVGPRNRAKSAALARQFPGQVRQVQTNQAVLDNCSIVLLATPPGPQNLAEATAELALRPDHHVISMVAGVSYELLVDALAPAGTVTIALPLPPAEWHASTTPVFPKNELVQELMGRLGTVIPLENFGQLAALNVGTLMGHFYKTLQTVEEWLVAHGISAEQAAAATGSYFNTFNQASKNAYPGLFAELVAEQTPRGLNEQVIREVDAAGGYQIVSRALDNIFARKMR